MPTATLLQIPLNQIQPSPHQARKTFNEEAIKGLAESMKQEGLIEPIVVQAVTGGYQLISGERRFRAAQSLGWDSIEAKIIQPLSDAEAAAKGLIENLMREDLNPIEEAEGLKALLDLKDQHWNQKQLALTLGQTEVYVSKALSLLSLPEAIKDEFRQRKLSREHGIELLRINNANSQKGMANKIVQGGWSVKQTREAVKALLDGKPVKSPAREHQPDPFAKLWDLLKKDPASLGAGEWSVRYEGKGAWHFRVAVPEAGIQKNLANWFGRLSLTLGYRQVGSQQKQAGVHLPKSPEEWTDLESTATQEGPIGMYRWIYGSDPEMIKAVSGATWKDLGQQDPIKACHEFVAKLAGA